MGGMMADLEEGLQQIGLHLDSNAVAAMRTLPLDHALELASNVKNKVANGHIKNPSSYVCATVVRGYVPEASGGAQAFCQANQVQVPQSALQVTPRPPVSNAGMGEAIDVSLQVARLSSTIGMVKAEQAGVNLTDDAVQALLKLPVQHASQLLEQVAEKKGIIRDLSNYVCATVARGYHPKEGGLVGGHLGPHARPKVMEEQPPAPLSAQLAVQPQRAAQQKGSGLAAPGGKGKGKPTVDLVPPDATVVETAVLDLNQKDLWEGQRLDAESLLALRCITEEQGMDLLGSLYSKGSGKGNVKIRNPNDYVQAAVAKIIREGGTAGRNCTGNQTRQKAAEMGMILEDETLQLLSKMPLRASVKLLEAGKQAMEQGEDPNTAILVAKAEADLSQSAEDPPAKRSRMG
mmetsp:Transcript_7575/g.9405  ORF Transcript_7575/g.9405 Transcript_7575/m.9405 type:complete len:404 (-) Transcript_7575:17-1228(-)